MKLYICPDWLTCQYTGNGMCSHDIPHKHTNNCNSGITERTGKPIEDYAHPLGCLKCIEYNPNYFKEDEFTL